MKKSILLIKIVCLLLAGIMISTVAFSQKTTRKADVKKMIEEKNFVFIPQTVSPMSGHTRYLSPDFSLEIAGDSINAYLPYFGRAYAAPTDPDNGGINFQSKKFDYKITTRKKGGWNITITPKDVTDPNELFLTVFDNGSASLQVNSNDLQPISFNGYIKSGKNQ